MAADYLMYTTSSLFFLCYVPELYANYKNKNANVYNLPEKIIIFIATSLALAYAIVNNSIPLMTNYGPLLLLDGTAMLMRFYYVYQNKKIENNVIKRVEIGCETDQIGCETDQIGCETDQIEIIVKE
uniref:PQ loop repeat protein n=1 Tax=viral metagenome TaxID=1070528 RepID=A0A6C0JHA4_9ZZZZ